jgi:RNA-binding protein
MECLGIVETVSGEGRFVVKAETTPEIEDPVFDSKGGRIGSVKRIFGPVDGPYVTVVAADKSILSNIAGKRVFFAGGAKHGKDKRKHR